MAAKRAGISRIELVSAIEVGGITPSIGVLSESLAVGVPVLAMVRPRGGHFEYSDAELRTMERDIAAFREAGAQGVVFGVLDDTARVDVAGCRRLLAHAGGMEKMFHRAFDSTVDAFESLETLIDLGFTRILTCGRGEDALDGADMIRRFIDVASGRIEIQPGGGIRAENAAAIVAKSGASQIHLGPFVRTGERPGPYGDGYVVVDEAEMRACVAAIS
jgi:copper homeostasis protein